MKKTATSYSLNYIDDFHEINQLRLKVKSVYSSPSKLIKS